MKLNKIDSLPNKQKWRCLTLFLFFGVIIFFLIGNLYCNARKSSISKELEEEFCNLLLNKLQDAKLEGYISTDKRNNDLGKCPETILIEDENGVHPHQLDKDKSLKNITKDSRLRSIHSIYLLKHPLDVDTLYQEWIQLMELHKMDGTTFVLKMNVSEKDDKITSSNTPDSTQYGKLAPFIDYTIGYHNEVEIKGYFGIVWYNLIGVNGIIYCLVYWFIAIAICIALLLEKKKTKIVLTPSSVHVYQINKNIKFDADQRRLFVDNNETLMSPQSAVLLEHFLNAPDYILKDDEIENHFWSSKSYNVPRLHNAISRLRGVFEKIPSVEVKRHENTGYRLHIKND